MPPPRPLADLARALLARYISLTPQGLVLEPGSPAISEVAARLVRTGPARTLYRDRKPSCRSLDGLKSLKGNYCANCPDRPRCTPQLLLDLDIDGLPWRLLLSFTSAKNVLLFLDRLRREGRSPEGTAIRLRVLDRGRWGELTLEPEPL